jgi:predicted enzyme related to lactoylglutathione lyase
MPRIVHFELPAEDPERAKKFYEKVFGWKIEKWEGPVEYWLITTGEEDEPGINGAIMKKEDPNMYVYNTIEVPSFNEFKKKIEKNGGEMVTEKMAIPGIGYFAYFKDPEGNQLGIMESDESAK